MYFVVRFYYLCWNLTSNINFVWLCVYICFLFVVAYSINNAKLASPHFAFCIKQMFSTCLLLCTKKYIYDNNIRNTIKEMHFSMYFEKTPILLRILTYFIQIMKGKYCLPSGIPVLKCNSKCIQHNTQGVKDIYM